MKKQKRILHLIFFAGDDGGGMSEDIFGLSKSKHNNNNTFIKDDTNINYGSKIQPIEVEGAKRGPGRPNKNTIQIDTAPELEFTYPTYPINNSFDNFTDNDLFGKKSSIKNNKDLIEQKLLKQQEKERRDSELKEIKSIAKQYKIPIGKKSLETLKEEVEKYEKDNPPGEKVLNDDIEQKNVKFQDNTFETNDLNKQNNLFETSDLLNQNNIFETSDLNKQDNTFETSNLLNENREFDINKFNTGLNNDESDDEDNNSYVKNNKNEEFFDNNDSEDDEDDLELYKNIANSSGKKAEELAEDEEEEKERIEKERIEKERIEKEKIEKEEKLYEVQQLKISNKYIKQMEDFKKITDEKREQNYFNLYKEKVADKNYSKVKLKSDFNVLYEDFNKYLNTQNVYVNEDEIQNSDIISFEKFLEDNIKPKQSILTNPFKKKVTPIKKT
jgi:hypothetical protein